MELVVSGAAVETRLEADVRGPYERAAPVQMAIRSTGHTTLLFLS